MMTRQDLEQLGHEVKGTYRGPLDWELCNGLYDDLQQCKRPDGTHVFPLGALCIVRQDPGFNIVTVEVPKPVEMTPEDLVALRQRELRELADEFGYELMETGPGALKYRELRRLFAMLENTYMFTVGRIQRAIRDGLLPSFTGPELRALVAWLDTLEATPETEEIRQTVMMRTVPQEDQHV